MLVNAIAICFTYYSLYFVASCCSNFGYLAVTSDHSILLKARLRTTSAMSARGMRTWFVESRSRNVTDWGSLRESKSMVMP